MVDLSFGIKQRYLSTLIKSEPREKLRGFLVISMKYHFELNSLYKKEKSHSLKSWLF